jgi:hypothetical protein
METRSCARCGTSISTDRHLCDRCLQELPVERPVRAGVSEAARPVEPGDPTTEPDPSARNERPIVTWRGEPVPPGMILPSRTQYHGTMYGLIAVGVVITLVLAVLVNKGVGPFAVTGTSLQRATTGTDAFVVVAQVENQGQHSGTARCVAIWTDRNGGSHLTPVVVSGDMKPGSTVTVSVPLSGVAAPPSSYRIDCK